MTATITIVTPTIDSAHYIDHAVGSVPRNGHVEVEHIVVHDGGSTFAERLREKYPWLRVVSGPARGATAATAAAIAMASGDFVFQLNSDDRMLPGSLTALAGAAAARPDFEVWTGGTRIFESDAQGQERTIRTLDDPQATALTLANVLDDLPLMTARFVRRSVYERIGGLDERFSACSDREFAIRMILAGVRDAPLDVRVSELRLHDDSRTIRSHGRSVPPYLDEHIEIARRLMAERELSHDVRSAFRGWHARETLRKICYETRIGRIAGAGRTLRAGFSSDWLWPWRAPSMISALQLRRRQDSPP